MKKNILLFLIIFGIVFFIIGGQYIVWSFVFGIPDGDLAERLAEQPYSMYVVFSLLITLVLFILIKLRKKEE